MEKVGPPVSWTGQIIVQTVFVANVAIPAEHSAVEDVQPMNWCYWCCW